MGIILYPTDSFNEKFLIKIRDCVVKLSDDHPVKKWLKWLGKNAPPTEKEIKMRDFLLGIISSQFNLMTDAKIKNRIIEHISEIPSTTLGEKILKSYLYLMIGNITRSDNILKDFIKTSPRMNWQGYSATQSLYHQLASENIERIIAKFSKHPADRRNFELFSLYLRNFFNDTKLLESLKDVSDGVEDKIYLTYIERQAPRFVHYLKLKKMSEERRIKSLRNFEKLPLMEQSYWEWAFMDIRPLISDALFEELKRLEKEDELWFIYLMADEKLADIYIKKGGKILLPSRRTFLRKHLNETDDFMLSLFKLIEIGDVDSSLVSDTVQFITHE